MLMGFAESDFDNRATQVMEDGVHQTYGVFQMSDRWWGTKEQILDLEYSTLNRLHELRKTLPTQDIVQDCWLIQRWSPSDHFDRRSTESQNYANRLRDLAAVTAETNYFRRRLPNG